MTAPDDPRAARLGELVEKWRANADMLADGNKSEWPSEAVGMQRACADELAAALSGSSAAPHSSATKEIEMKEIVREGERIMEPSHIPTESPNESHSFDWENLKDVLCNVSQVFGGWRPDECWTAYDEEVAQRVVAIQRTIDTFQNAPTDPIPLPRHPSERQTPMEDFLNGVADRIITEHGACSHSWLYAIARHLKMALAADPILRARPPREELDNHHNALTCPYCNPEGLKFAAPSSGGTVPSLDCEVDPDGDYVIALRGIPHWHLAAHGKTWRDTMIALAECVTLAAASENNASGGTVPSSQPEKDVSGRTAIIRQQEADAAILDKDKD